MSEPSVGVGFTTLDGVIVPAVTAQQMRRVDELAENQFRLSVLQMMENAGRNLAQLARSHLSADENEVTILAGSGGNGGGGLALYFKSESPLLFLGFGSGPARFLRAPFQLGYRRC